jgi:small subunit ribosomal protein S6
MFLLDTSKVGGDVPAAAQQLHTILERNQAEVLASRPWEERRLAYPVRGQKKGLYYLIYFRAEGKALAGIERDCALNEMILRQMVLKVDPKLEETMLALARDEHALALKTVTAEPGEEGDDEPPERPRRRGEKD